MEGEFGKLVSSTEEWERKYKVLLVYCIICIQICHVMYKLLYPSIRARIYIYIYTEFCEI